MTTIVEFLLARLAEHEAAARAASFDQNADTGNGWQWGDQRGGLAVEVDGDLRGNDGASPYVSLVTTEQYKVDSINVHFQVLHAQRVPAEAAAHIALNDPKAVLADIAAKRRILDMFNFDPGDDGQLNVYGGNGPETWHDVLQELAVPFAEHPDYQGEWAP